MKAPTCVSPLNAPAHDGFYVSFLDEGFEPWRIRLGEVCDSHVGVELQAIIRLHTAIVEVAINVVGNKVLGKRKWTGMRPDVDCYTVYGRPGRSIFDLD